VEWSEADGLRTALPHVRHQHGRLSLTAVKQAVRTTKGQVRRQVAPPPALRDIRVAIQTLAVEQDTVFSLNQLCEQLQAAGTTWAHVTIKELVNAEVTRPDGRLIRVRQGHYRLRVPDTVRAEPSRDSVAAHVQQALELLAAAGRRHVTRRDVEAQLKTIGVPYSGRAVRDGLLQLQRRAKPVVERTADGRYRLSPTRRRTHS
jgi:hypothetical protein